MDRRRIGMVMSAAGVLLLAASVIGWSAGATTTVSASGSTTSLSSSNAPTTASSSTTTLVEETVPEFFARWATAITAGDVAFLLDRLHPAVLDAYGEAQCRDYLIGVSKRPISVEVRTVGEPKDDTLGVDGVETPLENVQTVQLYRADQDHVVSVRIVVIEGEVRWFTDCGDPVSPPR